MKTRLAIVVCLLVSCGSHAQDATLSLTVTVEDAEPSVGQIIVSLFRSENYMQTPTAQQTAEVDADGRSAVVFRDLTAGEYAVSVIYDEDMDGELDTGFLRIPTEKIGFSNNAKSRFGPASYEDAKFLVSSSNSAITIQLVGAK